MGLRVRKRIIKSPDVRRQEILDAAVRVFAEKGIYRTTVADITESAGVAKGTFYLYFSSKDHLLGALKERFVDETLAHAAALYERVGQDDWWGLVDTAVENFIDFMLDHRDLIHVFAQEGVTPDSSEVFAECERKLDEMFAGGIQAGVDAGAFSVSDPGLTASFLHHAVDGVVLREILYGTPDRHRLVIAAKELVRKILAA